MARVVRSAYAEIGSIQSWAVGAAIHCSSIWMVIAYQFDRVVKICLFIRSLVISSVVPISFLLKAINFAMYWVTVPSGDG
jgi:hypothetical protein